MGAVKKAFKPGGLFNDPLDVFGGQKAREASASAERLSAQATALEREQLEYIKQTQEPFLKAGERALERQEEILPGILAGPDYEAARESPAFQALQAEGEEAILRQAAATGGLRGGRTQAALLQANPQLLNQIAEQDYARRVQQFGLLGQVAGQGQAGAQVWGGQTGGITGNLTGILGQRAQLVFQNVQQQNQQTASILGLAAGALAAFSDIQLKKNVKKIYRTQSPFINIYSWDWNDKANELGLYGPSTGYLVQEVEKVLPDLVLEHETGFKQIDIEQLERRIM